MFLQPLLLYLEHMGKKQKNDSLYSNVKKWQVMLLFHYYFRNQHGEK